MAIKSAHWSYTNNSDGTTDHFLLGPDGVRSNVPVIAADGSLMGPDGNYKLKRLNTNSVMFLGDSLMQDGTDSTCPLANPNRISAKITVSLANINANGAFVRAIRSHPSCPVGAGTLTYTLATDSFTWAAFGDTAGAAVSATNGGWLALESATANSTLYIACIDSLKPSGDASNTVTVPTSERFCIATTDSFGGYIANRFDIAYGFAISGIEAETWIEAKSQWKDIETDLTVICLGTNDIDSNDAAAKAASMVQYIANLRRALGSEVVIVSLLPSTSSALNLTHVEFNRNMEEFCRANNISWCNAYSAVSGSEGAWVAAYTNDDTHPNGLGAYVIYRDAIKTVLDAILPEEKYLTNHASVYHATNNPYGNLTAYGLMAGTSGTDGTRATGDFATGWTCNCLGGSVATAVGSKVARTDGVAGEWQRIVIDNTDGVDNEYARFFTGVVSVPAGSYIELEVEYKVKGTGISSTRPYIFDVGTGFYSVAFGNMGAVKLGDLEGETLSVVSRTGPVLIESNGAATRIYIEQYVMAGGIVTIDIGRVNFHYVPAP